MSHMCKFENIELSISLESLKSQVVKLQTAQTWANAGVCGGLCTCAVGGTYN